MFSAKQQKVMEKRRARVCKSGTTKMIYRHIIVNVCSSSRFVLTAIFPGGSELAGTEMSPFWIWLQLRVMEVAVTIGAIIRAKL